MYKKHFHCPVNGWDCPCYHKGICELENPMEECDDFYAMWGDDVEPSEYTCTDDCLKFLGVDI